MGYHIAEEELFISSTWKDPGMGGITFRCGLHFRGLTYKYRVISREVYNKMAKACFIIGQ